MRLADHPKKLGLLLLPLVPLTAIGIVEVVNTLTAEETTCCVAPPHVKIEQGPPAPAPAPVKTTPSAPA